MVDQVPVSSSNLKSIGYDAESRTLRAEFNSGAIWDYSDVPPEKHVTLIEADADEQRSVGSEFHRLIKLQHQGTRFVENKEDAAA